MYSESVSINLSVRAALNDLDLHYISKLVYNDDKERSLKVKEKRGEHIHDKTSAYRS